MTAPEAPEAPAPPPEDVLAGTELADVELLGVLGTGRRSVVHAARWRGRDAALKVYTPGAIERHARRHPLALAEFEHARNAAFHRAPGLAPYVAEPLGRVVGERGQAFLQERVDGELYWDHWTARGGDVAPELFRGIERIVALAHAAGLYEIDLHARNVLVALDPDGTPRPVLFDFNLVPLAARSGNPVGWLLRRGLLGRGWRDRRRLRHFHDRLRHGGVKRRRDRFFL